MINMKQSQEALYSENSLWLKLKNSGKKAGSEMVYLALKLYYAALDPKTPKWARLRIYSALGYFVLPLDALPDFIPVAGYSDDLVLLTLAVSTVAFYINDSIKNKAKEKTQQWLGKDNLSTEPLPKKLISRN